VKLNIILSFNYSFAKVKVSCAICYYKKSEIKLLSILKKLKILCVGLISFKNSISLMDYIIPISKHFFSDIYILHNILKKLIKYKCLS
jgi:hypothetical protein